MPLARHDVALPSSSMIGAFLLTCLLRGMTKSSHIRKQRTGVSTHMPLARHDAYMIQNIPSRFRFYSHASCEAWPTTGSSAALSNLFLLTCLLRGMTPSPWPPAVLLRFLLTCLLRGMTFFFAVAPYVSGFYSHASCEAWLYTVLTYCIYVQFLLTCLLRGMTVLFLASCCRNGFLLTCLLRGMTAVLLRCRAICAQFLLTCLLRGMTRRKNITLSILSFYSHASCEAWQVCDNVLTPSISFYSHASCEAWLFANKRTKGVLRFYSHASCEAWRSHFLTLPLSLKFLLTCLLRGMTKGVEGHGIRGFCFYSHASCEAWPLPAQYHYREILFLLTCLLRGMTMLTRSITSITKFLLTCLLRGMTFRLRRVDIFMGFLLTCLLRGMTAITLATCCLVTVSTHMPLARHDNIFIHKGMEGGSFYSHASCEAWRKQKAVWGAITAVSTHMPLARHDIFRGY